MVIADKGIDRRTSSKGGRAMTNRTPERERAERRAAALHEAVRVAIRKGEGYEEHAA